jgi:hypothetical protein
MSRLAGQKGESNSGQMINVLINKYLHQKAARLKKFSSIPLEMQQDQLFKLLHYARDTEFGRQYEFDKIRTINEFRNRVPLMHYEEFKPYIDSVREGKQNIIWPTPINWFAKSSGTTDGKSKFIPVTAEGLRNCHFKGGTDTLAVYSSLYPKNKLFDGKCLTLGGSHQIDKTNKDTHQGDLSAIMIQNMPFYIHSVRTPGRKTALLANWDDKLARLTKEVIKENVTSFAGVPSWNLVLMKHVLEVTGKKNLLEVWPNMELFMHGGVNFKPYKEQYRKLFPSDSMHYIETYNASEGFFSIQNDPSDPSMLLMLDYGMFYEFIPIEQLKNENPQSLHIGEVETGRDYAMAITSCNGLWRYIIGDTIKFNSLFPHKIVITGRTKHFINAFGEELVIDNAERALHEACMATGALISEYTAAPVYMNEDQKGAHEWVIEFDRHPEDIGVFATILDRTLMDLNSDYEAKRYKNITIDKPIIKVVQKNTFYRWFKERNKLGGQNKIPRLSNERKYVEEVLRLID